MPWIKFPPVTVDGAKGKDFTSQANNSNPTPSHALPPWKDRHFIEWAEFYEAWVWGKSIHVILF